jgi:hypothetical protein
MSTNVTIPLLMSVYVDEIEREHMLDISKKHGLIKKASHMHGRLASLIIITLLPVG